MISKENAFFFFTISAVHSLNETIKYRQNAVVGSAAAAPVRQSYGVSMRVKSLAEASAESRWSLRIGICGTFQEKSWKNWCEAG